MEISSSINLIYSFETHAALNGESFVRISVFCREDMVDGYRDIRPPLQLDQQILFY